MKTLCIAFALLVLTGPVSIRADVEDAVEQATKAAEYASEAVGHANSAKYYAKKAFFAETLEQAKDYAGKAMLAAEEAGESAEDAKLAAVSMAGELGK